MCGVLDLPQGVKVGPQDAVEGKTAAEVSAALIAATGADNASEVLIQKRSTLALALPAGSDPASHLASVEASVCAGA